METQYTENEVFSLFKIYIGLKQAWKTFNDEDFGGDKESMLKRYQEIYKSIPQEFRESISSIEDCVKIDINGKLPLKRK